MTSTGATLRGFVFSTEAGVDAQYWFRYGTTTAYGSQTPERTLQIPPGTANQYEPHPVSEPVTGLAPWTDHHYQLCTAPPRGACYAGDQVFTTGPRLAFVSDRGGGSDVWTMDPGGHDQTRLTNGTFGSTPAVSPDGSKIAFSAYGNGGNLRVWTMNPDGSDIEALTEPEEFSYSPDWSPDGTKIVFARGAAQPEIAVMDADGANVELLTDDGGVSQYPEWSPDGDTIAYYFTPGNDEYEIRTIPAGGGDPTSLGAGVSPSWSPDSQRLAFMRDTDIWVMDADGENAANLTESEVYEAQPAWSPDGSRIAYDTIVEGVTRIGLMHSDGSGQLLLTGLASHALSPSWFPFR